MLSRYPVIVIGRRRLARLDSHVKVSLRPGAVERRCYVSIFCIKNPGEYRLGRAARRLESTKEGT